MAPGVLMPTTDRQGSSGYNSTNYTQTFNGTSSACPIVAGVAALVLSVNPNLTFKEVNDIIEQSAQKVRTDLYSYSNTFNRPNGNWNNELGYGLVNAHQAVLLAQSYGCSNNLTITQVVNSGQTDNQEASATITATNTINSGAIANYDAGTTVFLKPGFNAKSGSIFKAFIEGCAASRSSITKKLNNEIDPTSFKIQKEKVDTNENVIIIYPNPTKGDVFVQSKKEIQSWSVTNLYQKQLFRGKEKLQTINLQYLPKGIYVLQVIFKDGEIEKKKIIKE